MRHQRWQAPSDSEAESIVLSPSSRGSWRARALSRLASVTLRPLTTVVPATDRNIWLFRRIVAGSLALFGPARRGTAVRPVDVEVSGGLRVRGEWVRAQAACAGDAAILYVHGSGYAVCSARTHRGLTSRLSAGTALPVFACDYRLAPRHRFPDAADDVRAAFDWLVGQGYRPERIVLAGDSAGGHLAVDLALDLIRAGLPAPSSLVLFSPLVDLTLSHARERERQRRDPMISAARARRLVALYTRDVDPVHARLAFTITDASVFPATLIQAGALEMLAADAEYLASSIRGAGGHCELDVWPDQMHVFQALPVLLPEAGRALATATKFIRAEIGRAPLATEREETA